MSEGPGAVTAGKTSEAPKIVQDRLEYASVTLTVDTYSHVLPTM